MKDRLSNANDCPCDFPAKGTQATDRKQNYKHPKTFSKNRQNKIS